jgi:hypothetical protein
LLSFFLTIAGGEREENWEGGALLPLESLSCFFVLNICFFVHKWREKQRGNTGKPTGNRGMRETEREREQGKGNERNREGNRPRGRGNREQRNGRGESTEREGEWERGMEL